MRIAVASLATLSLAIPLFAGALALRIMSPDGNPEAQSKHLVLLARTTACHSPEKTRITATAEGIVNGAHRIQPLNVISLSSAGTFGIARDWPSEGRWVVKIVATNPEYKNYATGALVDSENGSVQWSSLKTYFHQPSDSEVAALLATPEQRASLQ